MQAYTGRTDAAEREAAEDALRRNEVKALVATSALGMGFDKPDLGFVVHLGAPSSPVAYYQQVGRAGRAIERADVLLLPGSEDRDIWRYFATASMPRPEQAGRGRSTPSAEPAGRCRPPALETVVDVRRTRLELLLKVLDVDGAVQRVPGRVDGDRAAVDLRRRALRAGRRRARGRAAAMLDYERDDRLPDGASCAEALDDPTAADCGRCDRCAGPWYPIDAPGAAREARVRALAPGRASRSPARAQWPTGMDRLGVPVKGRIPADEQVAAGRAVARLTDLGWGTRLRELLAGPDRPADDALLAACVAVLAGWGWERRPAAVATVPSRRRPELVASVGAHLARVGRLALARGRSACRTTGREANPAATAPSAWPASGARST